MDKNEQYINFLHEAGIPDAQIFDPANPLSLKQQCELVDKARKKQECKPTSYDDVSNAQLFSAIYGDELIHTDGLGWLHWNGTYWEQNDHAVEDYAIQMVDTMLDRAKKEDLAARVALSELTNRKKAGEDVSESAEHAAMKRLKEAEAFLKHARTSRKNARVQAIIALAVPMLNRKTEDFDSEPERLNTPGGVIDLPTGAVWPCDRDALCTKCTRFAPGTKGADIWDAFLKFVTCEDAELEQYLKMRIGECLYGKLYSEGIDLAFGSGGNGKSTFFNAVVYVLGSYSTSFDASVLTGADGTTLKHELAALRGVRFAVGVELEDGKVLSSAFLKRMSSRDPITAEEKYRRQFTLLPCHSLCLHTNFLPKVNGDDYATWRRIRVIPFDAEIVQANTDPHLFSKLIEECGQAIMQWAVDGAREFAAHGYRLPQCKAIQAATEQFGEAAKSNIHDFLRDACIMDRCARTQARPLYQAYTDWAKSNELSPETEVKFSQYLLRAGYQLIKPKNARTWLGIHIKDSF